MSEIGLYSGLYARFREQAELVDRVLIALKKGSSKPSDHDRKKLAELLIELAKASSNNFSVQLLTILLRNTPSSNLKEWEKVGKALLSNEVPKEVILKLEKLAEILEYERADIFAKMRGGYA